MKRINKQNLYKMMSTASMFALTAITTSVLADNGCRIFFGKVEKKECVNEENLAQFKKYLKQK